MATTTSNVTAAPPSRRLTSPVQAFRQRPGKGVDFLLLVGAVVAAAAYLILNRDTGATHVLTTSLDRHIPLLRPFAIPYLVFLPVFWGSVLYAFLTGRRFRALAVTMIVVYIISDIVFATFQTHVPRPTVSGGGVFSDLVRFIYDHDKPYNGFPSEHSSSATILAIYFVSLRSRWPSIVAGVFAVTVIAATLFVKQHVIADAAGGVTLALLVGAVAFMRLRD